MSSRITFNLVRKLVSIALLALIVALQGAGTTPILALWLKPDIYSSQCENKDRPVMKCHGCCKMRQASERMMGITGVVALHDRAKQPPPPVFLVQLEEAREPRPVSVSPVHPQDDQRRRERSERPELPPPKA